MVTLVSPVLGVQSEAPVRSDHQAPGTGAEAGHSAGVASVPVEQHQIETATAYHSVVALDSHSDLASMDKNPGFASFQGAPAVLAALEAEAWVWRQPRLEQLFCAPLAVAMPPVWPSRRSLFPPSHPSRIACSILG